METKASNARGLSDLSRAVAAQICAERSALGLNQKEGYQRVGMAKGTYIRIEKGQRPPDVTQLEQIASAYGLTVVTLMSRATERMNDPVQLDLARAGVSPEDVAEIADNLSGEEPGEDTGNARPRRRIK